MAKLLWEWKPRFAVSLVVRDLLIVTSHINCDITSGAVVMPRYANADGDEQRYKTSKTQVSLTFSVNCDRGRIVIDHLYGLRCRGWYCTNHSSADRIVVNSYNHPLVVHVYTRCPAHTHRKICMAHKDPCVYMYSRMHILILSIKVFLICIRKHFSNRYQFVEFNFSLHPDHSAKCDYVSIFKIRYIFLP